ncbi:MAG TPA: hypothetical protein VK517_10355 [Cyclobacteriaceae bacterium]|nr:hypothetical protein [Cyclobacteriaceae bacterium]
MKNFCLIALLVTCTSLIPDKLIKTKIAEGITVTLPSELKRMPEEDVALRYPSVRAPLGAFTNQDRVVDFSVNVSATQWPDENLEMAKQFFKAGIYNLYDRIEMIHEGIYEIHKKKFIYFEFESRLGASKMKLMSQEAITTYTYIQYIIEPGRAIVFSFNCPREHREEWQEKAAAIMKSVRVK